MNDLLLAVQQPEDTAFYCYRAIEALKTHAVQNLTELPNRDSGEWEHFRTAAGCTREDIELIKKDADPLRHSNDLLSKRKDRETILSQAWTIVENYLERAVPGEPTAVNG